MTQPRHNHLLPTNHIHIDSTPVFPSLPSLIPHVDQPLPLSNTPSDDNNTTISLHGWGALDGAFCDEPITFEHEDRHVHIPNTRYEEEGKKPNTVLEVGEGLMPSREKTTTRDARQLSKGATVDGRKGSGRNSKDTTATSRETSRSRSSRERVLRLLEENGSSADAKQEGKLGACASFAVGVVMGLIPVLILGLWCWKAVKRDEGTVFDERWLGYGTTLGILLLVGVLVLVVLMNKR